MYCDNMRRIVIKYFVYDCLIVCNSRAMILTWRNVSLSRKGLNAMEAVELF